jgi:hypothetical protein
MPNRKTAQDFARDVADQSKPGKNQYTTATNRDGTASISKNGIILHTKVFYSGEDRITIWFQDGSVAVGNAADFLNTLN